MLNIGSTILLCDDSDYNDYSDYNYYRDRHRDKDREIESDLVNLLTQLTFTDKLRNLNHDIEG